jgi:putative aldouronate transport system substrate-binding protein
MDSARRITLTADPEDDRRNRLGSVGVGGAYKPGGAEFDSMLSGYTLIQFPSNKPILTTGGIIATMQAINRVSKNPERALMLLEVLNNNTTGDPFNRFYNTLCFGIEGVHWTTDGTFRTLTDTGAERYNTNSEWMFASNFQAIPLDGQPADVWEQTIVVNQEALVSPLCGFLFDAEPVKGEVGACSAVIQEYVRPLSLGVVTEAEYEEFLTRLDAAGADTVITEMQAQVDAWLAAR